MTSEHDRANPSDGAYPTVLLGFEGVATPTRTPMWTSPVLGDDERRMMVPRDAQTYERVSERPWVCPTTASELASPIRVEVVPGHGCLVLDREDVACLRGASFPTTGRVGRLVRALDSGAADATLALGWLGADFAVWYCSPEEAFDVRERLREAWWARTREHVAKQGVATVESRAMLRDLAFRVQRSAGRRIDWAYAIAALEHAGEIVLARRLLDVVVPDVGVAEFDAVVVGARAALVVVRPRALTDYAKAARANQSIAKQRKAA